MSDDLTEKANDSEHEDAQSERESNRRMRMRFDWNNLIEDLIEDGRQRGLFDDLPGAGKPLKLGKRRDESGQLLANQLMADNELRPPWLTRRLAVEEKVDEFRQQIRREWQRYERALAHAESDTIRTALRLSWDDLCKKWETEIVTLNKLIADYNLRRPSAALELYKLTLAHELERLNAPRHLN